MQNNLKLLFSIFVLFITLSTCNKKPEYTIKRITMVLNPYEKVNWIKINQYKANFHAHTNNSDGIFNAEYVVDSYSQNGYAIIAVTDHNLVTYPWTEFSILNPKWKNRNPDSMKVLTFPGNELSVEHHRGMFFARITGGGGNLDSTFIQIQDSSALTIFNHPGRYWNYKTNYIGNEKYSPEWYIEYFKKYPAIIGMEVYNCPADCYPFDRILWDEILTQTMPNRPVWGFSNDDMHDEKQLMGNYEFMLMKELSIPELKTSMKDGAFYISNEPGKSGLALAPRIDSIKVDKFHEEIKVFARNYKSIRWISGVNGIDSNRTNNIISEGEVFNWKSFDKSYIRFELMNEKGVTLSQPFGFSILK